jgi:nucleotide-binding universal stress UspA family protein
VIVTVNAPEGLPHASVLVAFVAEDDELDHVTDAALRLGLRDRARVILYDRDAASAFSDPLPNRWASQGEDEQYGDPLSDQELVKLGREPLARKVARAREAGVDAWGWLPERHGTDTLLEYARRHGAELVLLPAELDDPGLGDRLRRETAGQALRERGPADPALVLVGEDGSTELA